MDEFYDTMTLVQTEKIHRLPVALVGSDFWDGQLRWMRETMLDRFGHISPEDLDLFRVTDEPAEAVEHICANLAERDRRLGAVTEKWDTPEGKVMP
jgi:predicted Rossmann-fold nucleotide-binding protein